jgi:hypothetical protein
MGSPTTVSGVGRMEDPDGQGLAAHWSLRKMPIRRGETPVLRNLAVADLGQRQVTRIVRTLAGPEHFYLHAIRFEEMFAQLVLPLRDHGSWRIDTDYVEETATQYRRHTYQYQGIDIIVLEGIYLLKRAFQAYYDLSIWIECSFDTALERAIAQAQEGLPPAETVHAYRTIYFPAQEIHFQRDDPRSSATMILNNDPRLDPFA